MRLPLIFNRYACLLYCLMISFGMYAQLPETEDAEKEEPHCGSDILLNRQDTKREAFEQRLLQNAMNVLGDEEELTEYRVPVVFHIVHQNGAENIPDSDVQDALRLLNDAFRNEAPFASPRGVPVGIRFCMGSGASNITRHQSALTNVVMEDDDLALKEIGAWPARDYINIWVVNSISSLTMGPSVAGYAMMPYTHGAPFDGVVVEAAFVNGNPDMVKVLVHEMGHYLGLYHTFEGSCKNDNCQTDGDRVCDTPPDRSVAPVGCDSFANTCTSDEDDASVNNPFRAVALGGLGDQPDMHQNYMDYGFQECQNTFTAGQRKRMRDALLEARSSLIDNAHSCTPCATPFQADISHLPETWPAGVPLEFTVNTDNESPLLYIFWMIDNTGASENIVTRTFYEAKTVTVKAYVYDLNMLGCDQELTATINITCPVAKPVFTANSPDGLTSPGETVRFETEESAYQYSWQVDGANRGMGASFDYLVDGTEGRLITLIANNGLCQAVSEPYYLLPGNCADSKENNVWYFGSYAGIDFNYKPARAIQGKLTTEEGCAVLCDIDGTPLFYSNGSTAGNSQTGAQLLNGDGLTGTITTTQSALFVPVPGSDRYVYLFTVDAQAGETHLATNGGISYSVIDRLGDNGKGEVTEKNTLLLTPAVEKVTAVKNHRGDGIWVIAHEWNSDAFYAWQVTAAGIGAPVISRIGSVLQSPVNTIGTLALGEMKASPSGRRIAMATQGTGSYEVFDFDNHTGKLSNAVFLKNSLTASAYGVSFSPNERYLYGTPITQFHLIRFDLHAGDQEAVSNSAVLISNVKSISGGSIQSGPDGKIYMAHRNSPYLSVISNPNAEDVADCGFEPESFKLAGISRSFYGLPNPVQSVLFSVRPVIYGADKVCIPHPQQDTLVHYTFTPRGRATYSWIHKGPNTFTSVNDTAIAVRFTVPGTDTLILTRTAPCNELYDTLYITSGLPVSVSLGPDHPVCSGASVTLDAGPDFADYRWSQGARTRTISVTDEGTYSVQVQTAGGCIARDSVDIVFRKLPELDLGRDTSICSGESIVLTASEGMDSYLWSNGATTAASQVAEAGSYTVTVGKYGCLFTDTIHIWKDLPEHILGKDTLVACVGSPVAITAPDGFDSYTWKRPDADSWHERTIDLKEAGYYVLEYASRCGTASDSVYYEVIRIAPFDTLITCADTVSFTTLNDFTSLQYVEAVNYNMYESNGRDVTVFGSGDYVFTGYFELSDRSACHIFERVYIALDTAAVRPDKSIDLGPDLSYCEGNITALNAGQGFDSYLWNTGEREPGITAYGFGTYYVQARYCGYDYADTIHIYRTENPDLELGPDRSLCPGETLTLDAGEDFEWYQWDNGSASRQRVVSSPGRYAIAAGSDACIWRDTIMVYEGGRMLTISGEALICENELMLISADYISGGAYVWDSLGVEITGTHELSVTQPGSYRVRETGCPDAVWSLPLTVEREAVAAPVFSFNPQSVCEGEPVEVRFDAAAYTGFYWHDTHSEDNPAVFDAPATPVLIVRGQKCQVAYTAELPLKHPDDCITTGLDAPAACQSLFYLAPNPGSDYVSLGSACAPAGAARLNVQVSSLDGKSLERIHGSLTVVNEKLNQLMPQLKAGMYLIEVTTGTERHYLKWSIAK